MTRTPRFLLLLLCLALLFPGPLTSGKATAAAQPLFSDVPDSFWAREAIEFLKTNRIMNGFADGTFRPMSKATRAEVIAVVMSVKGIGNIPPGSSPFRDVNANYWAYASIVSAYHAGVLSGYADGTFRPNNGITRAEIASMLTHAFSLDEAGSGKTFTDIKPGYWAYASIQSLANSGVASGLADGRFLPNNGLTRAELAAFIARIVKLVKPTPTPTPMPTVATPPPTATPSATPGSGAPGGGGGGGGGGGAPGSPAATPTPTATPTLTAAPTPPPTATPTLAATPTPSATPTPTLTAGPTPTPTPTATMGSTATPTPAATPTPSVTSTVPPTPIATPSVTPAPTGVPQTTLNPGTPVPRLNAIPGVYTIELDRWGISNKGVRPVETTAGINNALRWISQQGYREAVLPAGTYLIDKASRITMVSNLTLTLTGATLQKEANAFEEYYVIYIGPLIRDVTIRGGTFIGDRDKHDYSNGETHEWGYGIAVLGGINIVIENNEIKDFTGDGVFVGAADGYVAMIDTPNLVSGSIDNSGKPLPDTAKIRTNNKTITNFTDNMFKTRRVMQLSYPKGLDDKGSFDIYFYNSTDNFISSVRDVEYSFEEVPIPANASYYRAVFDSPTTAGVTMRYDTKIRSFGVTVRNNDISNCRRQGITIMGVKDLLVTGNKIHGIHGTAPESGIDAEGDMFLNSDFQIIGNELYNNAKYDIILYDGRDALVKDNRFSSPGAFGITNTEHFTNARIINNTFQYSSVLLNQDVYAENNKVIDSWAKFTGPNAVIQGMQLTDSYLEINATVPGGVKAYDVTLTNNMKIPNSLVVNGQAAYLYNFTINGPSKERTMIGNVANGTVYDRLTITNYNGEYGLDLPRGIYNQCTISSNTAGEYPVHLNRGGVYEFNQCTFKGKAAIYVNNIEADVTISDSTFAMDSNLEWPRGVITAQAAKKMTIRNNVLTAMNLKRTDIIAMIRMNETGGATSPTDVLEAVIQGNRITTNIRVKGISTRDAGIGAPPYRIEDNFLNGASLDLRPSDINRNNTVK